MTGTCWRGISFFGVSMEIRREKVKAGCESVWDYPRPPRVEPFNGHLRVIFGGREIASTNRAIRVLETSHPPNYYIPRQDIAEAYLYSASGNSFCEWKGIANYITVRVEDQEAVKAGWTYLDPTASFSSLRGYVAFYAGLMDACYVDGEKVTPQPGGFYGGWITSKVTGPFKGEPGTMFW